MSYILDALKKSEQERGHGAAPGIQTVHSSSLNYHAKKRSIWPWILIAAVLLNLAALLYFIFDRPAPAPVSTATIQINTPPPAAAPENVITNTITNTSSSNEPPQTSVHDENISTPPVTRNYNAAPTQPAPTATDDANFQAVDISQLPDNIRQQIPALEFTAHVYSSNPQQRSVVVNGRFMEEGEQLSDDLMVKEITSTGVVMDFRGYLFRSSVITGW